MFRSIFRAIPKSIHPHAQRIAKMSVGTERMLRLIVREEENLDKHGALFRAINHGKYINVIQYGDITDGTPFDVLNLSKATIKCAEAACFRKDIPKLNQIKEQLNEIEPKMIGSCYWYDASTNLAKKDELETHVDRVLKLTQSAVDLVNDPSLNSSNLHEGVKHMQKVRNELFSENGYEKVKKYDTSTFNTLQPMKIR